MLPPFLRTSQADHGLLVERFPVRATLAKPYVPERNRTFRGANATSLGPGTDRWPSACMAEGHYSVPRIDARRTPEIRDGPKSPRKRPPIGGPRATIRIWSGR